SNNPLLLHIGNFVIFEGVTKSSTGVSFKNSSIKLLQIGAAPKDPATPSIGLLSLFPTHTPTARCGVYPIVHASLKSSVVPVLTAATRERVSAFPNSSARAALSERIEFIKNVYSEEMTCCGFATLR